MIRTYLELAVQPGKADELAAFFERNQILQNSVDQLGCHSAELTMSDDGLYVVVPATWDDRDAYGRWVSRADRESTGPGLSLLLREPVGKETVGKVFDVVLAGTPPEPA